jgi:hypothetical protein
MQRARRKIFSFTLFAIFNAYHCNPMIALSELLTYLVPFAVYTITPVPPSGLASIAPTIRLVLPLS